MFLPLVRAVMLLGATAAQGKEPMEGAPTSAGEPQPVQVPAQRQIESLYSGALVGAKDGEDFAETPGYRQLLEILSQYGEDELQTKADRRLDWQKAIADPDSWR